MLGETRGGLLSSYPPGASPLRLGGFFDTLYARYDERFVVSAPDLLKVTRRLEWDPASPGLNVEGLDYTARIASV